MAWLLSVAEVNDAIALAFTQYEKELTWKVTKHKREVKQERERKETGKINSTQVSTWIS